MAFATRLAKVRYHCEHCNERTWMCYHQAPPLVRVVAHVGDAGQAKPHLEPNPLSLLGTCHAMPLRKLNDPAALPLDLSTATLSMAVRLPAPRVSRLGSMLRRLTCYRLAQVSTTIAATRCALRPSLCATP